MNVDPAPRETDREASKKNATTPRLERARARAAALVASPWFTRAVVASIAINCVVVALETNQSFVAEHPSTLQFFHFGVILAFATELGLRLLAHGREWRSFFADPWTRFDLVVLSLSLVPAVGPMAAVARLARVLRVARIVSVSPKLRLIIATMARSIPSLGHVALLLGLLLFVYGVLGVHLFRESDPAHWGDLGTALLTLFQIITLEGWVELQKTSMIAEPWAWVFYASFVLLAVFVVVNLFVAVVLSNLDQARRELAEESAEPTLADVLAEVQALRAQVEQRGRRVAQRTGRRALVRMVARERARDGSRR
ncbi:MAG: ion transporter [Kofleriaceae bacterium]